MLKWIKNNKLLVVVCYVFVVIGVPVIIHCLFKLNLAEKNSFFVAEWNAGELLLYYGGLLSFSGTVILGVLSLHQNDIIKQESDRRIALQEKREHDVNMPKFRVKYLNNRGSFSNVKVLIENISDNIANDILVYKRCVVKDNVILWENSSAIKYDVIKPNDSIEVRLDNEVIQENEFCIKFDFRCDDKYGEEHRYHVFGVCSNNRLPTFFSLREI